MNCELTVDPRCSVKNDESGREDRLWNSRSILVAGVLVMITLLLALKSGPNMPVDDAAIGFRYIERFVSGHGLTYNDHEHVQGFSCPLYILLLSGLHFCGLGIQQASIGMGIVFYVLSVLLVFYLAFRITNLLGGGIAGVTIALQWFYRYQILSGMEVGFAVCLGLSSICALERKRHTLAGFLIGLAIINKLDAGLLAAACALAAVIVLRRIPWRMVCMSILTASGWFLFALYYYGSILPQSIRAKIHHSGFFDPWWIYHLLRNDKRYITVILVFLGLAFLWKSMSQGPRLASLALMFWFLFHGLTYSLLNLGANYPWYLTALFPPLQILGTSGIFCLYRPNAGSLKSISFLLTTILFLAFYFPTRHEFDWTINDLVTGSPLRSWEVFDMDRRLLGIFLNQYADQQEVLISGFGWTDYESRLPIRDDSLINSQKLQENISYFIGYNERINPFEKPGGPDSFIQVATFDLAYEMFGGENKWFVLYAKTTSAIVLRGARFLKYGLRDFPRPEAYSLEQGVQHIRIDGDHMNAPPPSGAVFTMGRLASPVRLSFIPRTSGQVRFTVLVNGMTIFDEIHTAIQPSVPLIIPFTLHDDRTSIAFLTTSDKDVNQPQPVARWENMRILIGDSWPDVERITNPVLREAWCRRNQCLTDTGNESPK